MRRAAISGDEMGDVVCFEEGFERFHAGDDTDEVVINHLDVVARCEDGIDKIVPAACFPQLNFQPISNEPQQVLNWWCLRTNFQPLTCERLKSLGQNEGERSLLPLRVKSDIVF